MAESDVTTPPEGSGPEQRDENAPRARPRRRIPGFLIFGVVAATIEMGIVLALLYC